MKIEKEARFQFKAIKAPNEAPEQSLRDVQGGTYKELGGKSHNTEQQHFPGKETKLYTSYFPAVLIIQELSYVNLVGLEEGFQV